MSNDGAMPDTPPPLPLAVAAQPRLAARELRVAPPHAPLFWRTLAFLVDWSALAGIASLIAFKVVLPRFYGEDYASLIAWFDESQKQSAEFWLRYAESATFAEITRHIENILSATEKISPGALHAVLVVNECFLFTLWIGFSLMEILTGGASLGKKMFRLRVVRFPHGETPMIFDSVMRSCWKAISCSSGGVFTLILAAVDAHWPLFHPLRRSLHDILCRTVVLDARHDLPNASEDKKPSGRGA